MLTKDLAIVGTNMELRQGLVIVDIEGLWWFGEVVLLVCWYVDLRDTVVINKIWQSDQFVWLAEKVDIITVKISVTISWTD